MTKDDVIQEAKELCEKFIGKVDTGRARSKETYRECKHLLATIEIQKEEAKNNSNI